MALLAVVIILAILAGAIWSTDRIDSHWKNRGRVVVLPTPPRPFLYSRTQCVDCGTNGDLLSIDTGQCLVCFELAHG